MGLRGRALEEERLRDLRERYANDEFGRLPESVERLELHVSQVLAGEQPTWPAEGGLPFSPDPALRSEASGKSFPEGWGGYVTNVLRDATFGLGFVDAAESRQRMEDQKASYFVERAMDELWRDEVDGPGPPAHESVRSDTIRR
jgi:hypothetical protein